jgi:hypothetical protein
VAAARRGARQRSRRDTRSALNCNDVPSRPQRDQNRDRDDKPGDEHELDRRAPAQARAEQPSGGERDEQDPGLDEQRLPVRRVPELRRVQELERGADDAGHSEQQQAGEGHCCCPSARCIAKRNEADERADPGCRAGDVEDVGDDVHAIQPAIEGVPRDGRDCYEPDRHQERGAQGAAVQRCRSRERRNHDCGDETGAERGSGACLEADSVRLLSRAEGGEDPSGRQHEHDPLFVARPSHEREERHADGDEQTGQ